MQAVKVRYSVRDDYVETNKANIAAVMAELKAKGDVGVRYAVFIESDGKTFNHFAAFRDEAGSEIIPGLPAFQHFREQLQGGAETPPEQTDMEMVNSSVAFF